MKTQTAVYIFLSYTLISCNHSEKSVKQINYNHGELHHSTIYELRQKGDEWNYGQRDSSGVFNNSYNVKFDSTKRELEFWDDLHCELLDSLIIVADSKPIKIYKFMYDVPDGADEELYIYISKEYGLMGYVELAWNGHSLFIENNQSIIRKLEADTTGFFRRSK